MSLKKLVHREVIKIAPDASVSDTARVMRHFKIGSVFVAEGDSYVGIVTESDLVRKVAAQDCAGDTIIRHFMCAPLIKIDIEKSVIEANHLMRFNEIRHLGISENDTIVGMISVRDIVRFFSEDTEGPMHRMGDVYNPLEVLIHRDIQTIHASASSKAAAEKMAERKIGSLMVTEEEKHVGIVTESDIVRKVISYDLEAALIPVGVIMNTPIIDINIGASALSAVDTMSKKGIRHLAVSEAGNIVGIISIRDLIGLISVRDLPRFFAKK
ncbi:MAG: CBS domain-containing protein [Nitrospiria bacterium]